LERKKVMKSKTGMSNVNIVQSYLNNQRPFITVGYITPTIKRKPGNIWKDAHGVMWEQREGYKTRINPQAEIIKKITKQICKNCKMNIDFGNKFDRIFFYKTGMCQDCVIEYETKLRAVDIYPIYEKYKMFNNELGFLKDVQAKVKEVIGYFNKEDTHVEILCNSDGFREKFHGTNKDKILENAKKDLKSVNSRIVEVNKLKLQLKKEFKIKAKEAKIKIYV